MVDSEAKQNRFTTKAYLNSVLSWLGKGIGKRALTHYAI